MTAKGKLFGLSGKTKERLVQKMLDRRSRNRDDDTPGPYSQSANGDTLSSEGIPKAYYRFEYSTEYQELLLHKRAAEQLGIENPYFRSHDGCASCVTVMSGRELVNFASYNYLNLNGHPDVSRAAKEAIDHYGSTVSASRLISGERPVHAELETALADIHGAEDCIAFVSGHATNVSTIGTLFGGKDLIVHDALIHNSVLQGAKLSGARRISFPHNDMDALDNLLTTHRANHQRVLIVVEGLYSMDGDIPDLARLVEIKNKHKAFLMVDEAHSIGVLGAHGHGIGEHFDITRTDVDIWMGTLSKTLAGCGGYAAGSHALVDLLKTTASGFVYSVGLAPPIAAASLAALTVMGNEPERVAQLRERGALFLELAKDAGLDTANSQGFAIIPVMTGNSVTAARLSNSLFDEGINVQPIVYPAVEDRRARLRFFLSCAHTPEQIQETVKTTAVILSRLTK